MADYTT